MFGSLNQSQTPGVPNWRKTTQEGCSILLPRPQVSSNIGKKKALDISQKLQPDHRTLKTFVADSEHRQIQIKEGFYLKNSSSPFRICERLKTTPAKCIEFLTDHFFFHSTKERRTVPAVANCSLCMRIHHSLLSRTPLSLSAEGGRGEKLMPFKNNSIWDQWLSLILQLTTIFRSSQHLKCLETLYHNLGWCKMSFCSIKFE